MQKSVVGRGVLHDDLIPLWVRTRTSLMKVLVVEDDPSLAESVRAHIQSWGHEAERCLGGRDALRMFPAGAYDVVLMEVRLPDMKGDELIRGLKDISPDVGVVTMTDRNSRDLELRIRDQGVLYYMLKPFEAESFKALLEHLAGRTRGPEKGSQWT